MKSCGEPGTGPGQFHLPHAIVADRNNNLYVADRTNRRIQVFDTEGKFLRMFTIDVPPDPKTRAVYGNTPTGARLAAVIGAPNSICITQGPNQVLLRRRVDLSRDDSSKYRSMAKCLESSAARDAN